MDLEKRVASDDVVGEEGSHAAKSEVPSSDVKSRILEKIRRDMQRGDEPGMLAFESGPGHFRYTSAR
jgi:hypothetical protein